MVASGVHGKADRQTSVVRRKESEMRIAPRLPKALQNSFLNVALVGTRCTQI
jgi:hypothetical protein